MREMDLPVASKSLLQWLAYHACNGCGYTFVGVPTLQKDTGCGDSTIRRNLHALEHAGLLAIIGQGGGRGKATEYVVLPEVPRLSTGKCVVCGRTKNNLSPVADTPPQREGIAIPGLLNPPAAGGYSSPERTSTPKPSRSEQKNDVNPPAAGAQPEVESEPEPPRARAREEDPSPSARGPATPAWFGSLLSALHDAGASAPSGLRGTLDVLATQIGPDAVEHLKIARRRATTKARRPETAEDARRRATKLADDLAPKPVPTTQPTGTHGTQEQPADGNEAEDSGQDKTGAEVKI